MRWAGALSREAETLEVRHAARLSTCQSLMRRGREGGIVGGGSAHLARVVQIWARRSTAPRREKAVGKPPLDAQKGQKEDKGARGPARAQKPRWFGPLIDGRPAKGHPVVAGVRCPEASPRAPASKAQSRRVHAMQS